MTPDDPTMRGDSKSGGMVSGRGNSARKKRNPCRTSGVPSSRDAQVFPGVSRAAFPQHCIASKSSTISTRINLVLDRRERCRDIRFFRSICGGDLGWGLP